MADAYKLADELSRLSQLDTYDIPYEHDLRTEDPANLLEGENANREIKLRAQITLAAVEAVAESSDSIKDPEIFDIYQSMLMHAEVVPGHVMSKLLDSIISGLSTQVDIALRDGEGEDTRTCAENVETLERYAFLIQWFVGAAAKVKSQDDARGDEENAVIVPAKKSRSKKNPAKASTVTAFKDKEGAIWTWHDQIPGLLALIARVMKLKMMRIWGATQDRDTFVAYVLIDLNLPK